MSLISSAISDLRQRPAGNVPVLDVLRTAAILLVICDHVGSPFGGYIAALPAVSFGWTGVDLFFVLSGFLIGGQLWKELKRSGTIRIGRFILRRGFRIWPLYFSVVLVVTAVVVGHGRPAAPALADWFCLSNYLRHYVGGGWSLATEEQFYILAPLILFLASRKLALRHLLWIPTAWLLALPLLREWAMRAPGAQADLAIYMPFHTHSDGLAIGLVLAWVATFHPQRMQGSRGSNWMLIGVGVAVGLFLRGGVSQIAFGYTALALIFGALTWAGLRSAPIAACGWGGFYVGSRLSYGVYLNHFYIFPWLVPWVMAWLGRTFLGFAAALTAVTAAAFLLSFLTFSLIELPLLRIRGRVLGPAGPERQMAAGAGHGTR